MSEAQFIGRAAAALVEIVRNIKPDQLDAATPCSEFDVRKLINHLLFWGPSLEGAGRKETVPPPAGSESEVDLTGGDWAGALEAQIERTAASWSRPDAWEGVTHMGGPTEMPAAMVGSMVVDELVVHSWDLARATGQRLVLDGELLAYALAEVVKIAPIGREMGVYAEAVAVPESAPVLDRVVAMTGRDPAWAA